MNGPLIACDIMTRRRADVAGSPGPAPRPPSGSSIPNTAPDLYLSLPAKEFHPKYNIIIIYTLKETLR